MGGQSIAMDTLDDPAKERITSLEMLQELKAAVRGQVYGRDDQSFTQHSRLWNGNVVCESQIVVCPLDAQDVSQVIQFCVRHKLSPSVKAGGYSTAGWAIAGDVIVDLQHLTDIDLEPPTEGPRDWTSLRDVLPTTAKGKGKPTLPHTSTTTSLKRQRSPTPPEPSTMPNTCFSAATDAFLAGPPLPPDAAYAQSQRGDPHATHEVDPSTRGVWGIGHAEAGGNRRSAGGGVRPTNRRRLTQDDQRTTAPLLLPASAASAHAPIDADPFGYMSAPAAPLPTVTQHPAPPRLAASSSGSTSGSGSGSGSNSTAPTSVASPSSAFDASNPLFEPDALAHTIPVPAHPHAYLTFGAGRGQRALDAFSRDNPLPGRNGGMVPYYVPTAAHPVGSAIMLTGGFGFLSRLHGLSIDNVVEVEFVLADGRIVVASADEEPELFWAIRGGGPAFGIATRYKVRAHPVPVVFAGNLIYRFHRATAASLIRHFRDCVKGAPRELYANVLLTAGPQDQDSLVVVQMCYVGGRERGVEFLNAIGSWEGEGCLLNEVNEKSFVAQQESVAQVLRGRMGRKWFIRSTLITSLPDDIVAATVRRFADTPIGCTWLFELAGGAIADAPRARESCVPQSQRDALFTVAALHQWDLHVDDPKCKTSAEEWIAETIAPVSTGGPYTCFLGRHEPLKRVAACFGEHWPRLRQLKRKYDPNGLFKNTYWPLDAQGEAVAPLYNEPRSPYPDY